MDVIKVADYIVDVGVEGGNSGGTVLFAGYSRKISQK